VCQREPALSLYRLIGVASLCLAGYRLGMAALDEVTLTGFKSIRELKDFKLEKLNVLVGANGAGKSNLVDFFRMLRAMADGGLQSFITNNGGADGFFFNGPKEITAQMKFGSNQYRFVLESTVSGEMTIREEGTLYTGGQWPSDWHEWEGGVKESGLPTWKERNQVGAITLPLRRMFTAPCRVGRSIIFTTRAARQP